MIPHTETTRGKNMFRYVSRLISGLSEPPSRRNVDWFCFFTNDAKNSLYSDAMKARIKSDAYNYLQNIFETAKADNVMDRTYYTDVNAYLPEDLLVKMDIASMANSLEARSPFLDQKVMEFSATLPSSWKLRGLRPNISLRKPSRVSCRTR